MIAHEMDFTTFSVVDFPPINRDVPRFVYIVCWVRGDEEVPFYVGQTARMWGRLDDYYWAMFSASTDFRVGEAVRKLSTKGYRIVVRYKSSPDPRGEERQIIDSLDKEGCRLLNKEPGFDWRNSDELKERSRIGEFVDLLLDNRLDR
jgi:hypothetical protein